MSGVWTSLPATTIFFIVIVILFAAMVHGAIGLGFPLIATPLLSLAFDVRAAILVTLLPTAAVNIASILKGGNWSASIAKYWPFALYAVIGSTLGTLVIKDNDPTPFKLVLAALILLFLIADYCRLRRGPTKIRSWPGHPGIVMLGFGSVAGIAAGTTNVMVPILIIYTLRQQLSAVAMVQVFNMTFLSGKVAQIAVFGAGGFLDSNFLLMGLALSVVSLSALGVGMRLRDHIPDIRFRKLIKILLAIIAVSLITQVLTGKS